MKQLSLTFLKYMLFSTMVYMASSCKYYKTVLLPNTDKRNIEYFHIQKEIVTIADSAGTTQYHLNSLTLTDTTISGVLTPAIGNYKPHLKSIRKGVARKQYLDPMNTMHIYLKEGELTPGNFTTRLDNIQSIEIYETAVGKSILGSVGLGAIIAGGAAGIAIGIVAIICNCPFVESYNADTNQFHGSLFPGAIFESLAREDYLELSNPLLNQDGTLSLRVFNSMPEVEYIDLLELYRVNALEYDNVASLNDGTFIGYTNSKFPKKAISGYVTDVTEQVEKEDGILFDFSNLNQTEELNSLEVTFSRKDLSDHPKLTLVGKQSKQLDIVAHYLFSNIGNRYDEWVAKKDEESGAKWTASQREKGISLHVSLKEKGQWKTVGYIDNQGILSFRKLVLDLDLTKHKDSLVELRFESAYKIWELDQIALSDDYKMNLEVENIPFTRVLNQDSIDIKPQIAAADAEYYLQNKGGHITLETEVPVNQSILFLKGAGYYHHSISNDEPPNYDILKKMRHKLAFHEMSKALEQAQKWHASVKQN